jgi:predicted acetyltransferase
MRYVKDNSSKRYEEILDFANMVFSMEYNGIDFSSSFPKAYGEDRVGIVTHHMMVDDKSSQIRALIDTYPVKLKLDELSINADYVGTVSVHPRYRNRGLFSGLLEKVEDEALLKGTDLLILDGERQRYGWFGYEKAGMKYSFDIEYKSAINETTDMFPYSFEEVDADSLLLDKMYELYSRRNVTARDRNDFYISLLSMKATTYAVIGSERIVGYVNLSEDEKNINEFELEDVSKIPKLMLDIMDGFGLSKLYVTVGADEIEKIKYLEKVSSYYNVSQSHQIRILNYKKVIEFLLRWKLKYSKPTDTEYSFGIRKDERIINFKVVIKDSKVYVCETDKKAGDIFDEREFVKIFTTGYFYIANTKNAPTGWFPLPFFLPDADSF